MTVYTPEALIREFHARKATISGCDFFSRPGGMSRLREMWCAARFAAGVERYIAPCKVDIADVDEQDEIDFKLLFPGRTSLHFQHVETQKKGRRRGEEYRTLLPGSTFLDEPLPPEEAIQGVSESIELKASKKYASQARLHLLTYLNMDAYDLRLDAIRERCAGASAGFAGAWIVTGNLFGCLYLCDELSCFVDLGSAPGANPAKSPDWFVLPPSSAYLG